MGARSETTALSFCPPSAMNLRLRIEVLIEVCVTVGRVYGDCSTTQPAICVWRTHLHRRERGGETAMCAERDNRTMGPRRSTCGCGYGSELTRDPRATRRGGGDHEQIQKRVWGAQHQRSTIRPQAAQAASPLLPRRHVRYDRICKGGREGEMSLIRFLLPCFCINNNHHHRQKPLTS